MLQFLQSACGSASDRPVLNTRASNVGVADYNVGVGGVAAVGRGVVGVTGVNVDAGNRVLVRRF